MRSRTRFFHDRHGGRAAESIRALFYHRYRIGQCADATGRFDLQRSRVFFHQSHRFRTRPAGWVKSS